MHVVTSRIPDDTYRKLADEADETDRSMSELVREYVEKGLDYDDDIADLERTVDRLENEKRTLIDARDEHTELVEYVEEERRLQQRREERRDAPAWRRAKWWMFGRNRDGEESEA